jgi:hypothetical protein
MAGLSARFQRFAHILSFLLKFLLKLAEQTALMKQYLKKEMQIKLIYQWENCLLFIAKCEILARVMLFGILIQLYTCW